jgi:hypothetical protein
MAEETGAILGSHGDNLHAHAVILDEAANNGTAANLSVGQIEKDLYGAA